MMFWDASAIVPLLVTESTTADLQALSAKDPDFVQGSMYIYKIERSPAAG